MDRRRLIYIVLGILVFLLFVLIVLNYILSRPKGSRILPSLSQPEFRAQDLEQVVSILPEAENINSFTEEEVEKVDEFDAQLPFSSPDFDMVYSDLLGQYFIEKKSQQADAKLDEFLQTNGLSNVRKNFPYLFIITDGSAQETMQKIEDEFIKEKNKYQEFEDAGSSKDVELLTDLLKTLLNLQEAEIGTETPVPKQDTEPKEETPKQEEPRALSTFDQIFAEVESKIALHPGLLRAVMSVECGRLLSLPTNLVIEYSRPGRGIPSNHFCYRNGVGAMGPMQFMPGTWPRWSTAVNRFGGYRHRSYVENIRDSVYAAGEYLNRANMRNFRSRNWTKEQIRKAIVCYNAGCGRYNSGRIPAETQRYLERVYRILKI